MKIFNSIILFFSLALFLTACQKELSFDANGTSSGTLKKEAAGNCSPVAINGIYIADSSLNSSHFVDVLVNVNIPGTFEVKSDTINGFSFRKLGSVTNGLNTIRLYATGKPLLPGKNNFTITYGSSSCKFEITVLPAGSSGAVYTIGGAGAQCVGAIAGGNYTVGTALTPNNTLSIQVNVAVTGYYNIGAVTNNGFVFAGTGVFASTGLQNVVLTGSGTPLAAGNTAVTVSNLTASCTFSVAVQTTTGGGGGTTGNYYFQFNDGATVIAADTAQVVALMVPSGGSVALSVNGLSITGDSALSIAVTTTGNPQTGIAYNSANLGLPFTLFGVLSATNGQVYQADFSTPTQNIAVKFDFIDVANKVVKGTFSGTAKAGAAVKTITNGKFNALLQ